MKEFRIGQRMVGGTNPCFVVAEVSGNHNQKLDEAIAIVKAAAAAGADAIKLQTYTPDTMTLDSDKPWFFLQAKDAPASWKATNLYGLYKTAYTPWEWHAELKKLTESLGMTFFSTPFDATAVDFLSALDVPCFKIASYEATDVPLLRKVAATGKPVILSVGFATLAEIEMAMNELRTHGAKDIALLHCVTTYSEAPRPEHMNLRVISDLREHFDVVSGFSDNNQGIDLPIKSVGAGAAIVEKHVILNRKAGGPDSRFSLEPDELRKMVEGIRETERALGTVHYGPANETEQNFLIVRRSLFAGRDIKKGEAFTLENVRDIRPANGLETKHIDKVLASRAAVDIERGTPLAWDLLTDV